MPKETAVVIAQVGGVTDDMRLSGGRRYAFSR